MSSARRRQETHSSILFSWKLFRRINKKTTGRPTLRAEKSGPDATCHIVTRTYTAIDLHVFVRHHNWLCIKQHKRADFGLKEYVL